MKDSTFLKPIFLFLCSSARMFNKMWSQLALLTTICVAYSLAADGDQGRYYSDDSGRYVHNPNEGRYFPDNSGQYNPDFSGNYKSDGLGGYQGGGNGRYSGQKDPFGGSGRGSKFGSGFGNLVGANTFQSAQTIRPANPNFGNQPSATNNAAISAATGRGRYNDEGKWKIIRQVGDVDLDGYHWEYLTENGINAEESGKVFNQGSEEIMRAKGFFTYTGPDNAVYHIQYTADENGFVAQGDHIPTPPPVPEAILKSLAYQRSIGELRK